MQQGRCVVVMHLLSPVKLASCLHQCLFVVVAVSRAVSGSATIPVALHSVCTAEFFRIVLSGVLIVSVLTVTLLLSPMQIVIPLLP